MAAKKKATRTVLYSSKGKKLYAKRDAKGQFRDIQSYQRAHSLDLRRTSKAESAKKMSAAPRKTGKAKKKKGKIVAALKRMVGM
jgi:hypothetical protein